MRDMIPCMDCKNLIEPMDVFPKNRCLDCHKIAPEVIRECAEMTGEKLAKIWGAK